MGLIVQHDEIITLLKELRNYNGDELIIYTTLKTSQPFYVRMNYLDLDNYIVQGVWLAISETDIKLVPVDQLGKLQDEAMVIEKNEIANFTIKKNLLLYTISITDLKGNTIQFRASSTILGNKTHHEDFLNVLKKKNDWF